MNSIGSSCPTKIIYPPIGHKGDGNTKKLDEGTRVYCQSQDKWGTVKSLRQDQWEKDNCWKKGRYHYSVDFDDGTSESYASGDDLFLQNPLETSEKV